MLYTVEFKPKATKDLRRIPKPEVERVFRALEQLSDGLKGDVRRLTNITPEYRLRVGDYRILFEIEQQSRVVVYRVRPRKEAYRT